MGTTSDEVSHYKVCWRRGDSQHQPFAAFEGESAFSQAWAFYEQRWWTASEESGPST
jgi:hypothetical protein